MFKKRLIPVLLLKNGLLVRSEGFRIHQIIGNPLFEVKRFNEWNVDELIYLDITKEGDYDLRRNDHKTKNLSSPLQILEAVSRTCFMPLTWGGKIRSVAEMKPLFFLGADKVSINTIAVEQPGIVSKAAKTFGSQAIVVSIDVKTSESGNWEVVTNGGTKRWGLDPVDWAKQVEKLGAGEILIQSVERDGSGEGYDLDLIQKVAAAVCIPVIACSGVGKFEDYAQAIQAGASAAAAANIWHFQEMTDRKGKKAMAAAGVSVRL